LKGDEMKKITMSFILLLLMGLVTSTISADPVKGEKLLIRAVHDDCVLPAPRIAMAHSQAEWNTIFQSGKMEEEVAKLCQRKTTLEPFSTRCSKYAEDIHEYMEHYANDSGAIPA